MSPEARWSVPKCWSWTSIENIAEVTGGGTPPASDPENFSDDGGIPWITPADLTGYEQIYIARGRRNLSERGYGKSAAKLLPAGAVLFTSRAPIGYCAIAANPIATNQGFKSLTLFGGISGEFTRHYLKWSKSFLESLASGTTFLELSGSKLEQVPIPLPPVAEQKRIVAKLDALNAKSTRARTELARIETLVARYKQAVLSKAFSGELTREWRDLVGQMAPVKPRQAQQVKSSYRLAPDQPFEGPYDLPPSWAWLTLPYLGDLDRGKSRHRPRNDPRLYDGPFPFIQTGDVRAADQYVRQHSQTYSEFGLAQSKLWRQETLCITIAANIAETALLSYPACFPDSVVGFSADVDKMLPKYAEFFLRTAKERISQFAPATAQKNINLEILAAVRLPVAPIEEQHEIVRRIESAFAKIDRLAAEAKRALELLGKLDEAILAKAFRGELVPQDESDEPAEQLLARIRAERAAAPKAKRGRRKPA